MQQVDRYYRLPAIYAVLACVGGVSTDVSGTDRTATNDQSNGLPHDSILRVVDAGFSPLDMKKIVAEMPEVVAVYGRHSVLLDDTHRDVKISVSRIFLPVPMAL